MGSSGDGHPYIPNLAATSRAEMLARIGVVSTEDLYAAIPPELRLGRQMRLPAPFAAERDLRRHLDGFVARNTGTHEALSFLGGGCWPHDVPAVVDEIGNRAEFLTAYGGDTYADLGKYQAIFEFQSLLGELLGMDVVSAPTYDWVTAASSALAMAARITGRREVLLAGSSNPQLREHLRTFAPRDLAVGRVAFDPATGLVDLADLGRRLSDRTAAVYIENPGFLGTIEPDVARIAGAAHAAGALLIVGVDASSLGVLAPPAEQGADLVVGEAQPLGNHMHYGGGLCGFIASRDDPAIVMEYPTFLVSIAPGREPGEWGFGWSTMTRTSFEQRDTAQDYTGSSQWLWGITAATYLSLLGPRGMAELGETIMARSHYAAARLSQIPGVRAPRLSAAHFKEFVVDVGGTGHSVAEVNRRLLERGIFGGHDLSADFPELGQSALYCVTEVHAKDEIDRLAETLAEVVR